MKQSLLRALVPSLFLATIVGCQPSIVISGGDLYEDIEITEFPGIVGVPNFDDDNEDGTVDWDEGSRSEDDDEFVSFYVNIPTGTAAQGGLGRQESVRLSLGGDGSQVRIYDGDSIILGEVEGPNLTEYVYTNERDPEAPFWVEFRAWPARASVRSGLAVSVLLFFKDGYRIRLHGDDVAQFRQSLVVVIA